MPKPSAASFARILNGLIIGPPELRSNDITLSAIPADCTKSAREDGTQKVIDAEEKMRRISLAAGRLMIVSPSQFVPLTTIRDGIGGRFDSDFMFHRSWS